MPRYLLTVSTPSTIPPATTRLRVSAPSVRQALARLFAQKPEYDIPSLTLSIVEETEEDIS